MFIVDGPLPKYEKEVFESMVGHRQFYFTVDQVKKQNDKRNREGNNELNLVGYDIRNMNKLLAKERAEEARQYSGDWGFGNQGMDEEGPTPGHTHGGPGKQEPKGSSFFEGKGTSLGGSQTPSKSVSCWYDGDTDADTLTVVKMSLKEVDGA